MVEKRKTSASEAQLNSPAFVGQMDLLSRRAALLPVTSKQDALLQEYIQNPIGFPGGISKELEHWQRIVDAYEKQCGISELPFIIRVPVQARQGIMALARSYFGSMEGSLPVIRKFKKPTLITHDGLTLQTEPARKHTYTAMTGLRFDMPWEDDRSIRIARANRNHEFLYWRPGYIPMALIDMDIDASNGSVYIYEAMQHKFGWLWGIHRPLDVPVRGSRIGEIDRKSSLEAVNRQFANLFDEVGDEIRHRFGRKRSHFLRFLLQSAQQIATESIGQNPERIFVLKPGAVLQYRDEFRIHDQVTLTAADSAMIHAASSLWRMRDRGDGWLACHTC